MGIKVTTVRRHVGRLMVFAVLLTGSQVVCGQVGSDSDEAGDARILTADDGWPIHVTYFESNAGKEAPVAILIAGAEGQSGGQSRTRRVWDPTAVMLQKSGYAVVTVDLRKHGDSVAPADAANAALSRVGPMDYAAMITLDLEAVKNMLLEEHKAENLNIRKTGIVTAGSSSLVAAGFAVADWAKTPFPDAPVPIAGAPDMRTPRGQDVRAIMMFSPPATVRGLNTNAILRSLKNLEVAVYVFASRANRDESRAAQSLHRRLQLRGEEFEDFRKLSLANEKATGEDFLEAPYGSETNKLIREFLDTNVKQLDQPWQSRTSRLSQ